MKNIFLILSLGLLFSCDGFFPKKVPGFPDKRELLEINKNYSYNYKFLGNTSKTPAAIKIFTNHTKQRKEYELWLLDMKSGWEFDSVISEDYYLEVMKK